MTERQPGDEEGLSVSSAQGRWVTTASVLGSGVPTLDATVGGIALPSIGRDFRAGVSTLQWVVIGYSLTPASLAILQASFRPSERATAIGAWSGLGGVATAAGTLIGGYLISVSWRWVFFINIPVAVTALAVTARHVPESRGAASSPPLSPKQLARVASWPTL